MTEKDVMKIIGEALGVSASKVNEKTTVSNLPNWDSLGHLSVLVALDKAFEKKVGAIKEMARAESVATIIALLKTNGLLK